MELGIGLLDHQVTHCSSTVRVPKGGLICVIKYCTNNLKRIFYVHKKYLIYMPKEKDIQ